MLRQYVDARLLALEPAALEQAIAKSVELHHELWSYASEALEADPHSVAARLFIESLNEVIDLHHERLTFGLHHHIPDLVLFALYLITILAMTALGYQVGLSGSQRSLAVWCWPSLSLQ